MTRLSALAGALACAAAAHAQSDTQVSLLQTSDHIITEDEFFSLSEGRVNATKYLITDIFKRHGDTLTSIMTSGPGDAAASCSNEDRHLLTEAIHGRESLIDFQHDSCAPDGMTAPEGFEHNLLSKCLRESDKITRPCQTCFASFAKKIIGTPQKHGCNRRCVHWSAWCQDGYKDHCYWFISECFDCAKQPTKELLQCVGFPEQQTLMQAYDDYSHLIKSKPTHTQYIIADLFVNSFPLGLLTTPYIVQGSEH